MLPRTAHRRWPGPVANDPVVFQPIHVARTP